MIPHDLITRPLPLRDPEPVMPLPFDRGIEKFRPQGVVEPPPLPRGGTLPAPTAAATGNSRLAAFLAQPNINDHLLKQVFPENIDPLQTTPALFTQSLYTALEELSAVGVGTVGTGETGGGTNGTSGTNSTNGAEGTVNRARAVLDQQTGLMRLLQIYRSALYQG